MALHYSVYEMSDDEGEHGRGISNEDDEPQAIEEIVEGEIEPFNNGEEAGGDDDLDDLFGDPNAPPTDADKKEVKEKKVRKKSNIPRMNVERLKGPSGIIALDELFKDFKMKGRGHEEEDLGRILKLMQTWTHRMFPRFAFPDCIDQIERVGNKMMIKNFMLRNRNQPILADVTPMRLFDDDEDEAAIDDPAPAAAALASPRRGYYSDDDDVAAAAAPPPNSPPPPALPADLLERMRLNREAALRRRAERIREREAAEAAANGGSLTGNGTTGDNSSLLANGTNANNVSVPAVSSTLPFNETAANGISVSSKVMASSVSKTTNDGSSDSETPMDIDETDGPPSR